MYKKIVLSSLLVALSLYAIDDSVGVREYKGNCKVCHGVPSRGAVMLTKSEWDEMFANDNTKLKAKHSGNQAAQEVLNGEKFIKDSKKLLEFLENNAVDSGNVRGCSGASCG